MKVEVNEKELSKEIKYPCLMKADVGGVVLFHSVSCGVDLNTGVYSRQWYMNNFTPFNGTVTLQND